MNRRSFLNDTGYGIRMPRTLPWILGVLINVAAFSKMTSRSLSVFGIAAMGVLLAASPFLLLLARATRRFPKSVIPFCFASASLLLVYLVALVYRYDVHGMIVVGQFATLCTFFIVMSMMEWDATALHALSVVLTVGLFFFPAYWVAKGHQIAVLDSPIHSNVIAALAYHIGILHGFASREPGYRRWRFFHFACILFALIVAAITVSRTIWLALVAGACTYIGWPLLTRNRWLFRLYFAVSI